MTDPMHISTVMAEYLAELEAACAGNNPGRSPILKPNPATHTNQQAANNQP